MYIFRHLVRFFSAFVGIVLVDTVVPGFSANSIGNAALVSLIIAGTGGLTELFLGRDISPFARGIIGILASASALPSASLLLPAFEVPLLGLVLVSLLVGMIDIFVPVGARFTE
ncbi:hypothetical protein [Lihuaxuella thermophila]|uniref:Phage holin n=1 Tax=Lihuaxuella thermophila TaxID=1173111 RepID=A0A1H8CV06_9BACL|nr:hypothetical protein [Lihuaxuella thermophila]SEM98953.1 hypothetical protein SAMN05444955_104136 [Lihuaxuella thermophila]